MLLHRLTTCTIGVLCLLILAVARPAIIDEDKKETDVTATRKDNVLDSSYVPVTLSQIEDTPAAVLRISDLLIKNGVIEASKINIARVR